MISIRAINPPTDNVSIFSEMIRNEFFMVSGSAWRQSSVKASVG